MNSTVGDGGDKVDKSRSRHLSRYWQRCCSVRTLKRHIPILSWLPSYTRRDLKGDVIAGVTVGLTVIPQGLAYAQLASLPPQYGLYTAFLGCFVYAVFGTCKDLSIGPTAVMSLMTAEQVQLGGIPYAILLTFLCGCIQLVMGFLNLGFLVNFISAPVLSGFTSAAAIIIATSQLKGLFGLKFRSSSFVDTMYKFFTSLPSTNYWDLTLGVTCVVLLLIIRHFKDKKFSKESKISANVRRILEVTWWSLATGRNALMVVICCGVTSLLMANGIHVITLTQEVEPGLPPLAPPPFSMSKYNSANNVTETISFEDMVSDMKSGIIVIPLISILESIAIAKAFTKGKTLEATQEMLALGLCNFFGSFVSSYPVTASFSRTVINNNSGVRTPLGGLITGTMVLMALGMLAPYFRYIPKACLCAIVFSAVIFMIHYKDVPAMWRTNKLDLLTFVTTLLCSFGLGLEFGILAGMGVAVVILMYQMAWTRVEVTVKKTSDNEVVIHIKPDRGIFFPSVEHLKTKVTKALQDACDETSTFKVVFCGDNVSGADYTTALAMKNMVDSLKKQNVRVAFVNMKPSVLKVLNGLQQTEIQCSPEEDSHNRGRACNGPRMIEVSHEVSLQPNEHSSAGSGQPLLTSRPDNVQTAQEGRQPHLPLVTVVSGLPPSGQREEMC